MVSKCEGIVWEEGDLDAGHYGPGFAPSTEWAHGGPIIEREKIGVWPSESISGQWGARMLNTYIMYGPTPLIAAMRCFVASRLGEEVEVPEEVA
jgi:hypothetical protein